MSEFAKPFLVRLTHRQKEYLDSINDATGENCTSYIRRVLQREMDQSLGHGWKVAQAADSEVKS